MSESISIPNILNGKIPKTSLQFKQMIDENINLDIEPNKFIQISTYVALQMTNAMKQRDHENQQEYIDKRNKLIEKGKKWDEDSQEELTKIDSKKEEYQELLNKLQSKREILKSRLQEVHNKHTAFLQMERKKNKVLLQLEDSKKKLEKILVEKIEKDLYRFETALKKLDEIEHVIEYEKLVKKIKVCKLKKEVIHSKIECINKTRELTDLKSLDLNECHCVFCKGYSPAQYHFGIRKDINGASYRKEIERERKERELAEKELKENNILSDDDLIGDGPNDNDDDGIIEIKDVNSKYMNNSNQFDRKLSVIEEHDHDHSSEEKHDELRENKKVKSIKGKKKDGVDNLMKKLTKKREQGKKQTVKKDKKDKKDKKVKGKKGHKRGYTEMDIFGKLQADLNAKREKALAKAKVKDKNKNKKRIIRKKQSKKQRRGSTMNIKADRDAALKAIREDKKKRKRGNSLESNRLISSMKTKNKRDKPVIDLEAMIKGSKKKGKNSKSRREINRNRNKIDVEVDDALYCVDRDDEKAIKASKEVKNKRVVDLKGSKKKTNRKIKSGNVQTPIRRKRQSRASSANSNLQ